MKMTISNSPERCLNLSEKPTGDKAIDGGFSAIAEKIQASFFAVVARYDSTKYPEGAYLESLKAFSVRENVKESDIRQALEWKFGHTGKRNYPDSHKKQISRIAHLWESASLTSATTPKALFDHIRDEGERFVTAAFLTHLSFPDQVPIIDQHNFRAMNWFLSSETPGHNSKKRPSLFADLMQLQTFLTRLMAACDEIRSPNFRELDKYLMVLGKYIGSHERLLAAGKVQHAFTLSASPPGAQRCR